MGTATQLLPAFVDAEPLEFEGREYSKNMRPIRGYPNYWRIIDTESIVDGPITQGGQYVDDLYLWQAEILRDEDNALTDTIEVVNLGDYLTLLSEEEVNGETVYKYKYSSSIESFQYQHTDIIDSVSIEFDQSGRRLITFESLGDVFLLFFDSQLGAENLLNLGAGYNPQLTTDSYRKAAGSSASERLLFYVKDSTKQIVYRRQDDRFGVEYTLPSAPSDVVELLKVSKNIYGGLTALYCYDNSNDSIGEGSLTTGSFTARASADQAAIGTDGQFTEAAKFLPSLGTSTNFVLKLGSKTVDAENTSNLLTVSASSSSFILRPAQRFLNEQASNAEVTIVSGSSTGFQLESAQTTVSAETETSTLTATSATDSAFLLKLSVINVESYTGETATLNATSASSTGFLLG